jgi:hypothetical protein
MDGGWVGGGRSTVPGSLGGLRRQDRAFHPPRTRSAAHCIPPPKDYERLRAPPPWRRYSERAGRRGGGAGAGRRRGRNRGRSLLLAPPRPELALLRRCPPWRGDPLRASSTLRRGSPGQVSAGPGMRCGLGKEGQGKLKEGDSRASWPGLAALGCGGHALLSATRQPTRPGAIPRTP